MWDTYGTSMKSGAFGELVFIKSIVIGHWGDDSCWLTDDSGEQLLTPLLLAYYLYTTCSLRLHYLLPFMTPMTLLTYMTITNDLLTIDLLTPLPIANCLLPVADAVAVP
jgi:hypothetical protein